jgi:molybdenum cofactor cytidylyltransferase
MMTVTDMKITGVVLAAGASSRMGPVNKLTLAYCGRTIIEEVLIQMSNSSVSDILVVTGFEHTRIEGMLAGYRNDRIDFVYNRDYRLGRASSIKCAIERIRHRTDAALFMVADKPQVNSSLIDRAVDLFRVKRPALLFVETPAGRGHPIIFSEIMFDELMCLKGDRVGDDLVKKHERGTVRLHDPDLQEDIDSEEDYRALINRITRE